MNDWSDGRRFAFWLMLLGLLAVALCVAVPTFCRSIGLPWLWGARLKTATVVADTAKRTSTRAGDPSLEDACAVEVYCYPQTQGTELYTFDSSVVERVRELLDGMTFTYWAGYGAHVESMRNVSGGFSTTLSLLDTTGAELFSIMWSERWYVLVKDIAYSLDGDTSKLDDMMNTLLAEACEETVLATDRPGGMTPMLERRWLLPDEYESLLRGAEPDAQKDRS